MQSPELPATATLGTQESVLRGTMGASVTADEDDLDEQGTNSQRRSLMACGMCRKKKIKCELELGSKVCVQCIHRKTRCIFDSKKSRRDSLKRAQHIRWLKNRLRRVQAMLKSAGLLDENYVDELIILQEDDQLAEDDHELDDEGVDDEDYWEELERTSEAPKSLRDDGISLRTSDSTGSRSGAESETMQSSSNPCIRPASSTSTSSSNQGVADAPEDSQTTLMISPNDNDEPRYFGRSSTLSILSPDGLQWIRDKTGDDSLPDSLFSRSQADSPSNYWRPDVFHDLFASHVYKPLPPRAEVFALIKDYFLAANRLFPIYHEATFMRLVEWQYTQQTCNDAARWASINVMLAIAYRYRLSSSIRPERDNEKAWLYFKNALSVLTELTLRRNDLLSVQALLAMAVFLRGNSGLQSALPIVTAAVRSCHQLGLHRRSTRSGLSPIEQEQGRRVFWVAYILDLSVSVRSGNAPGQLDDFDIMLPGDNIDEPDSNPDIPFFRLLARLTVIKSRIYKKLYAAKSLAKSSPEVIACIKELNTELEEWKTSNQMVARCKQGLGGHDALLNLSRIGLQLAYYNALIMVNRMPMLHDFYSTTQFPGANPRPYINHVSSSNAICVQAARDSLKLVNTMPWGDIAWVWSLLYYLFLSAIIIFTNILRNAAHPKARDDIRLLSMAVTFFTTLIPGDGIYGSYSNAKFMSNTCSVFERIARGVVERAEKDSRSRKIVRSGKTTDISEPSSDKQDTAQSPSLEATRVTGPSEALRDVMIPDMIGVPPVESPGCVMPASLTSAEDFTSSDIAVDDSTLGAVHHGGDHISQTAAPMNLAPSPDAYSFFNNILVPPELWQIPLTADWETPIQFPGSVFSQGYSEAYGPTGQPQGASAIEQPGYGYNNQNVPQQNLWSNPSWNNNNYNFFQ